MLVKKVLARPGRNIMKLKKLHLYTNGAGVGPLPLGLGRSFKRKPLSTCPITRFSGSDFVPNLEGYSVRDITSSVTKCLPKLV
jgi:hypothetical protein